MRITQWGEYGLHFALYLAECHQQGQETVGANEIAESQKIELQYAQQILQRLRRGNIIESVRGPHGGYRLKKPKGDVSIHDIIKAAEGCTFEVICDVRPIYPERCYDPNIVCHLRDFWRELQSRVNEFLSNRQLADLLNHNPPRSSAEVS